MCSAQMADIATPLPLISCDHTGTATLARPFTRSQLHKSPAILVAFQNGRQEKLMRAPWSTTGLTSKRFLNERFVLKVVDDEHMARREACILNILGRASSVPKLYCAARNLVLMENVGAPLTVTNLPHDYRKQAVALLADLRASHVQHNDLWKNDKGSASLFATELLVDQSGRMRAIDFNTATVNGSYKCAPGIRPTALPASYDHKFVPSEDAKIITLLDALSTASLTLKSYHQAGVERVRLGLCRLVTRDRYLMARPTKQRQQRSSSHEYNAAACRAGSKFFGEFDILGGELSVETSSSRSNDRLPSVPNRMPSIADLRACMAACSDCERCHAISISSSRRTCLWFRPQPPRYGGTCDGISGSGISNETMLRTAWNRQGWPPKTNLSWEHRLDDFVTVDMREDNASADEQKRDWQKNHAAPPFHVRRPQGFNLEPYGLHRKDSIRVRSILSALEFEGPSMAMLPDGRLRCGVRQANEALVQSRIGTDQIRAKGGAGLFLVHSHEQGKESVAMHSRMLHLLQKTGSYSMLRGASLLLVNNNLGDTIRKADTFVPGAWLHAYEALSLRIRMLILTKVNLGYHCGEFQAIAASVKVLRFFPWVLYSSGPDSLPTPFGLSMLGSVVSEDIASVDDGSSRSRPGIVCEPFPAFPGLLRIRMDHFLFYPGRSETVWSAAAADCFRSGSANPEQLLAYHFRDQNVSMRFVGWNRTLQRVPQPLGYLSMWSKQHTVRPHDEGLVWHTHNATNAKEWISAQEAKAGMISNSKPEDEKMARSQFHRCALEWGQERLEGGAWTGHFT